ncbi:MAG: [Fe-Fe] hydrogenase large subunit C-terminal domain-containing protein [Nitrososphaerales archaeon]
MSSGIWPIGRPNPNGANWTPVVSTNPARCRDCYRCVRTCPVKAVRVVGGQAEVVPELCVECGACVLACPQKAKVVRDSLGAVKAALAEGRTVVASVAPSVAAYFPVKGDPTRGLTSFEPVARALAGLGFAGNGETALGAAMVGPAHKEWAASPAERWPVIASSCPVVVNLVEQVYPDLIDHIAQVVSPMVAHGRYLKQVYGQDAFVVFIGPCFAKKGEATDAVVAGAVDAALTFGELERWLTESGVILDQTSEVSESSEVSTATKGNAISEVSSPARLFPMEGGLLATAKLETDLLSTTILTGSGMGVCRNVLDGIRAGGLQVAMVELMACSGGCINGPALENRSSVAVSRQQVQRYAAAGGKQAIPDRSEWPDLSRSYSDRSVPEPFFTEEQIEGALRHVGKYSAEDELNCGSCGYASCREKAIATLRGMAEPTMCIPYMRARAESLNSVVMDVTPNAIVIVDGDLRIQDMSVSAERMFGHSRTSARGKPLQQVIPVIQDFVHVRDTGQPVQNKIVRMPTPNNGESELIVEKTIVKVAGPSTVQGRHDLMLAIFRDVTEREQQRQELEMLRTETLQRTQEVIAKQMRVAHEIAGLLGETTAETKVVLTQLSRLLRGGE